MQAARVGDLQTKSNAGPESEDERDTSTKGDHNWSARILSACTLPVLFVIVFKEVVLPVFGSYPAYPYLSLQQFTSLGIMFALLLCYVCLEEQIRFCLRKRQKQSRTTSEAAVVLST